MEGFNVETYQMSKKNASSGLSGYDELDKRISNIEKQQTNICYNKEFDFTDLEYTDEDKSTVVFTQDGIIPKQYRKNQLLDFMIDDDYIDYDESTNVSWNKNGVVYARDTTTAAELITFPIQLDNAMGVRIDSSYIVREAISGTTEMELTTGSLFTSTGVDKYGRLWVFTKPGYTNTASEKILLTIYNKDMTVYKTYEYDNVFANARNLRFDAMNMAFNEENVCFWAATIGTEKNNNRSTTYLCAVYKDEIKVLHTMNYAPGDDAYAYSILPPRIYVNDNLVFITVNTKSTTNISLTIADAVINYSDIDNYNVIYTRNNLYTTYGQSYMTQYKSNIFKYNNALYYFSPKWDDYTGDITLSYISLFKFEPNDNKDKISFQEISLTCTNEIIFYGRNSLNGMQYHDGYLYTFYNGTDTNLTIKKFKVDITDNSCILTKVRETTVPISANTNLNPYEYSDGAKFTFDNGVINIFHVARKTDTDVNQCVKYLAIDYDLTLVTEERILYETSANKLWYDVHYFNGNYIVVPKFNIDNNYTTDDSNSKSYLVKINQTKPSVQYYYLDDVNRIWTNVSLGSNINFASPVTELKVKVIMKSSTYNNSPNIRNINIQSWDNGGDLYRQSLYYTKQLDYIKTEGNGMITSNYEKNDGSIDWYLSLDGGLTYSPIELGEKFTFGDSTDFRIKIVFSVTDSAKVLPIVHNFTLTTNHVALRSDIETLQINIMKTNFKIDTFTNASKNGLLKMNIDTLSSNNFIDSNNSDYIYYDTYGYIGGNYIQTKPEKIDSSSGSFLLTTDEILDDINDKILYYISLDNGITFTEITPNVKMNVQNNNLTDTQLVLRAVFYNSAKLNAWGWAWD